MVDGLRVSNLTIDCNLAAQSAEVAAGAIKAFGSHIHVRRVRAINFGTRSENLKRCGDHHRRRLPGKPRAL